MSVIDSYLNTLFDPYPETPRMLSARAELREMMEDKQQALMASGMNESQAVGQVIAEFGSLEEVADALGIQPELDPNSESYLTAEPALSLDRARSYFEATRRSQPILALAISMFLISPIPLFALIAMSEASPQSFSAGLANAIGVPIVLVIAAISVSLLVLRSQRMQQYKDIGEERFVSSSAVRDFAASQRAGDSSGRRLRLIGVALFVLNVIPLIVLGTLLPDDSPFQVLSVAPTLIIAAISLFCWFMGHAVETPASHLLKEESCNPNQWEELHPAVRVIAVAFWPLATAIYLAWSFSTGGWDRTWVVWPTSGVLYAVFWSSVAAASTNKRFKEKRALRRAQAAQQR